MSTPTTQSDEQLVARLLRASDGLPDEDRVSVTAAEARRLVSRLQSKPSEGWRDIASAPRDRTEVDVWSDAGRFTDCHFHCGEWLYWAAGLDDEPHWVAVNPTHWQPLPSPPSLHEQE